MRLEHSEELGLYWYIGCVRFELLHFSGLMFIDLKIAAPFCEEAKHLGPNTLMH